MSGVPRDILIADLVVRAAYPVLGKATAIAEYLFVLVHFMRKFVRVESFAFILEPADPAEQVAVLSEVLYNFTFDLACGSTESAVLGWHVACITSQEVLSEVC